MGDEITVLCDEFPGAVAWEALVAQYRPAWQERTDKEVFLSRFGAEGISIVLAGALGDRAFEWFKKPIGAGDALSRGCADK